MSNPTSVPRRRWLSAGLLSAGLLSVTLLAGCFTGVPQGAVPVKPFDLQRYLGTWYEIARLDHVFERGLTDVNATYALKDDGSAYGCKYETRLLESVNYIYNYPCLSLDAVYKCRAIRGAAYCTRCFSVNLIGASGLSQNGQAARAVGVGLEHFLPKPYTAEVMLRLIDSVLKG